MMNRVRFDLVRRRRGWIPGSYVAALGAVSTLSFPVSQVWPGNHIGIVMIFSEVKAISNG